MLVIVIVYVIFIFIFLLLVFFFYVFSDYSDLIDNNLWKLVFIEIIYFMNRYGFRLYNYYVVYRDCKIRNN